MFVYVCTTTGCRPKHTQEDDEVDETHRTNTERYGYIKCCWYTLEKNSNFMSPTKLDFFGNGGDKIALQKANMKRGILTTPVFAFA